LRTRCKVDWLKRVFGFTTLDRELRRLFYGDVYGTETDVVRSIVHVVDDELAVSSCVVDVLAIQ
jgi:hypothetical protein